MQMSINIRAMPPNNQYNQPIVQPPTNVGQSNDLPKPKHHWGFIVAIVVLFLLLIGSLGFGYWAFTQSQHYKNDTDQITNAAVKKAKQEQESTLNAAFAEKEKSPLKSYTSPSQYGSVKIVYPKTWSAYIIEQTQGGGTVIDGYYYPDFVPNTGASANNNYSLRLQVLGGGYSSEISRYKNQISLGKLKSTPFVPEQVKGATVGVRLDGQLDNNKKGAMIILPVRDKVLKIWTENESALSDFNNYVIKHLTYSP
jgi:hypothetical protein